jgi:hypothetical protein
VSPQRTRWSIGAGRDLVVTYQFDPCFHTQAPDDLRIAACQPEREQGLVTTRRRARGQGLEPCPRCLAMSSEDPGARK